MNHIIKTARRAAVAAALAITATSAMATPINSVDNGGFTSPAQYGSFSYLSGAASGWTFAGRAGVASNGSPFNVSNAAGGQAAFLQQAGSSISQAFDFTAALFSVSFLAEGRSGYGANTISVLVDGIALTFSGVSTVIPGTTTTFTQYTSDFISLTQGIHTLSFVGTSASGDVTTFIDNVSIAAVPEPVTLGLFGLGLVALGAARRKAKSQA